MEYSHGVFDVEYRGDHIRVLLSPEYDATEENSVKFWAAVKEACAKYDSRRVLLEGKVPVSDVGTLEVVSSGVRASTAAPQLWFALFLEGYEVEELGELFKAVARSRGVHVRFFSDRDLALKWLRSGESESPTGELTK
ncbi:MAG: hypothetical protein WBD22_10885 [Pyrinomonadaceae bacterium]